MTHPIEVESYRRMGELVDLSHLGPRLRAVASRVIHASADLEYARSMNGTESDLQRGVDAIKASAPLITDVEMTRAGLGQSLRSDAHCYLSEARARVLQCGCRGQHGPGIECMQGVVGPSGTLSALAMSIAASLNPHGAIFVVGCAPTALEELLAAVAVGAVHPGFVIGLPVGFVGASEAKELLARSTIAHVTNSGAKGGSAVAAAAANALGILGQLHAIS